VLSIFFILVDSVDNKCVWMLTLYLVFFVDVKPWGQEAEVIREPDR
jgi:hypothetical protein